MSYWMRRIIRIITKRQLLMIGNWAQQFSFALTKLYFNINIRYYTKNIFEICKRSPLGNLSLFHQWSFIDISSVKLTNPFMSLFMFF